MRRVLSFLLVTLCGFFPVFPQLKEWKLPLVFGVSLMLGYANGRVGGDLGWNKIEGSLKKKQVFNPLMPDEHKLGSSDYFPY